MSNELKTKDELLLEAFKKTQHKKAKQAQEESEQECEIIYVDFKAKKRIIK